MTDKQIAEAKAAKEALQKLKEQKALLELPFKLKRELELDLAEAEIIRKQIRGMGGTPCA